jgi:hypothetical protein
VVALTRDREGSVYLGERGVSYRDERLVAAVDCADVVCSTVDRSGEPQDYG